jgi:hypothetical protein
MLGRHRHPLPRDDAQACRAMSPEFTADPDLRDRLKCRIGDTPCFSTVAHDFADRRL